MKIAVVTGGSQGLGKEIAKQLVQQNYYVILLARTEKYLKQTTAEIGSNSSYFICDITNSKQIKTVFAQIKKKHSHIDLLVNNAGVWTDDSLQKGNPKKMYQAIQTNLLGHIHVTEACLGLLKTNKTTRILNVISTSAVIGIPSGDNRNWKTYGASKWGFKGYSNALRESLRNTKIQVIQFFPGGFESNLYERAKREKPHNQPWMMKTKDVAEIAVFSITRPDDVYIEELVASKSI